MSGRAAYRIKRLDWPDLEAYRAEPHFRSAVSFTTFNGPPLRVNPPSGWRIRSFAEPGISLAYRWSGFCAAAIQTEVWYRLR